MPTDRHYPHAPITEALIDIRVTYDRGISLENLKSFGSQVSGQYPNESTRDILEGQITLDKSGPQSQSSRTTVGFIFHAADRRQAVQARLDGFTFSRFAPYEDWDRLLDETKSLWNIFVKLLQPTAIVRVSVRYINQINLPLKEGGGLTFEDYLRTFPKIGIDEDVSLEQFFLRLVMPQNDLSAKLILTEALLPPQGDHLGVILDIDLFRENLSLDALSNEIWDILETFRARKNKYFEASITQATRELFS
jgi:uncharacterized protein (TIGR04255 family)